MTMSGKISSPGGVSWTSVGSGWDVNTADHKHHSKLQYQNGEKGRDYPNGTKHLVNNAIDVNGTCHNIPQPPPSTPVLIIGGGPIGLLASILLAKRGIPSTVLERHACRLGQPKAHAINPRSLEIFRQAGLDTEYLRKLGASAQDAGAVRFVVSIKGPEFGMLPYERQDEGVRSLTPEPLFNIAQPILEQYLWEVALETGLVTIWKQWQWQSCVEVDDKMISSTILDRETNHEIKITNKYLLGCDGAHARSRAHFQIPFDTLDGRPLTPIHYVSVNFNADMSKEKAGTLWFIMTRTAGKRNFIAYDRSCNWVFVTTYDPKMTPRETFTEEHCRSLIDQSIGEKIDYEVLGITLWNTTPRVARHYRSKNIHNGFLLGDAAHCFPSTGGLGINTGFGDVHNLIWKLHAVESGQCDDSFLDTYEIERIPIAVANSRQSRANEAKIHALGRAIFGSGDLTAEERMQDPTSKMNIEDAIRDNADHFDSLDLQIGYIYGQQRPEKSVSDFTPQCVPGARLPHAWVQCCNKTISTLDLVRGLNFVLFATPGFVHGKKVQAGMFTLEVLQLGEDFLDKDGEWSRLMGLDDTQAAVLVRPDQHIVARVESAEEIETTLAEFLRFNPSISQSTNISEPSNGYMQHRLDTCDSGSHLSNNYHDYLPPPGHPRTAGLDDIDIYAYSKDIINKPKPKQLFGPWLDLLKQPFAGITTDGIRREGLYDLADEGAPTQEMVAAAKLVQDCLSSEEKRKACYDIDAEEWRQWCNPEFVFRDTGIRLTVLPQQKIDLILGLLKASLSSSGYEKAVGAMRTNHFLGEIVHAKSILNQHSYHFSLFGEPSETKPWGFSFFGHHLCLNVFVLGKQMTVSPAFVGAEPNVIDSGPWQGLTLLTMEASSALELMQSLSSELQQKAQIYKKMHDPAMPEGRWHPADQRHLGGAFQDNRVIPYEGIAVVDMTKGQQEKLLSVVATFLNLLPSRPFKARMRQIESYLPETYFCWIGGFGDEDPFYYRIQGPVICLEFDHHAGVFLLNAEPAKCHIHTILRTPNGNDYGKEWLRLFRGGDKVGNST